jgi:arylsulfatase A-like enzyme
LIDIAPTLAEILGVEPLDFWEGRSLWPLIEGGGLGLRGSLSMREEVDRPMKGRRGDRETALVLDGWKLIAHHETSRYSLFNLSVDPAEAHDLSSEQPVRLAALRKELEQRLAKLVRLPMRAQEEQMSDETFLQMQVLGYIDRDQQPPARTEPSDN